MSFADEMLKRAIELQQKRNNRNTNCLSAGLYIFGAIPYDTYVHPCNMELFEEMLEISDHPTALIGISASIFENVPIRLDHVVVQHPFQRKKAFERFQCDDPLKEVMLQNAVEVYTHGNKALEHFLRIRPDWNPKGKEDLVYRGAER